MSCRWIVPSGIAAGLAEITQAQHIPRLRTISHYPLSDHCSTHSSHIAVAYSIIDFQRIFLLLIGGNRFPCCGSGPPIANIRNIPIAIYASMGLAASSFQRANRAVSLATVILSQMLKLILRRGKMSSGRGWGVPLCRSKNIDQHHIAPPSHPSSILQSPHLGVFTLLLLVKMFGR